MEIHDIFYGSSCVTPKPSLQKELYFPKNLPRRADFTARLGVVVDLAQRFSGSRTCTMHIKYHACQYGVHVWPVHSPS